VVEAVWLQNKFRNHFWWRAVPLQKGRGSGWTVTWEGGLGMYGWVHYPLRRGDSGLVAPELSIDGTQRGDGPNHFRKWKLVLVLLGCALFCSACADDSTADNTQQRHHRRGNGHGRDQTETVDRSNNPSPTPALGW
jgi:hypothetical protein